MAGRTLPTSFRPAPNNKKSIEIEQIRKTTDIKKQSDIYLKLIERVGPVEAQEELLHSGLPFSGNTHLLNHTVGVYLYKKFGPKGIIYCKSYFSSSCYHGIIINSLADKKVDKVTEMMAACGKEGKGVLSQCVHGLGHGILPYVGYKNVVEALSMCDSLGEKIEGVSPFICHTGVFMENIWGVHGGVPSPDRWVDVRDPHYPCNDPRIEYKYRRACWYNQHTLMEKYYKRDIAKVGKDCHALTDKSFQKECFAGLFNAIEVSSRGNVEKQLKNCGLMPADWKSRCLIDQVIVEVSHGGADTSYKICSVMKEGDKRECYRTLSNVIVYYMKPDQQKILCSRIPREYRENECKTVSY